MEDLTEKITSALSDPEFMNTLKSFSGMLSPSNKTENSENENQNDTSNNSDGFGGFSFSPDMMQMFLKLMPILSSIQQDDKYTKFIYALKPLLSEEKQKKLDNSSQILKLAQILPILKTQGLLWGE